MTQESVDITCQQYKDLSMNEGRYVGLSFLGDIKGDTIADFIVYQMEKSCHERMLYLGEIVDALYIPRLVARGGTCGD